MAAMKRYEVEVEQEELGKYRVIRGTDYYEVERRAELLLKQWDEEWERKSAKINGSEEAEEQTLDAQEKIKNVTQILKDKVSDIKQFDWDSLLNTREFPTVKPKKPNKEKLPPEPLNTEGKYQPKIGFFQGLIKSSREKIEADSERRFSVDHSNWQQECTAINVENAKNETAYAEAISVWETQKKQYEHEQEEHNNKVAELKNAYLAAQPDAITEYYEMILLNSEYSDSFPKSFTIDYTPDNKIVIVEYELPNPDQMPSIKEVKYIASKNEFKTSYISETEKKKMYDSAIYQICLRTLYEIFFADTINAVEAVAFNGYVNAVDKSTGKPINPCILSIVVQKNELLELNLEHVNAKDCFRKLKGVCSASLYGMSAVAPLMKFDKSDKRIIEGREVIGDIDNSVNLAAMDWQDFEHFVRELLEKEFSSNQGEVKVTRSSRDEGVDAIAFDPDPIRGGKIVIQAKRYTNTVGVSAVRDLYGTIMNEGATKGLLITTSNYGPDSYEFAKGKPITLISGENLLFLLEKHGTHARIDLAEAKRFLADK